MSSSSSFAVASTSGRTAYASSERQRRRQSSSSRTLTVARSAAFTSSRPWRSSSSPPSSPTMMPPSLQLGKPLSSPHLSRTSPLSPRLQRGPAPPCAIVKKELLLQDVCSFLKLHCEAPYVGPSTKLAELAVASAKKRAEERRRGGFLGLAGLVRGGGGKKKKEGEEDGSSNSTTTTAATAASAASSSSSSSSPEPSSVEVEQALVDLFLSLEGRFDLEFADESRAARAVTVADASALLAREIELINESLRHIEII